MKKAGILLTLVGLVLVIFFGLLRSKRFTDVPMGAQIQESLNQILRRDGSRAYPGASAVSGSVPSPIVRPDRNIYVEQAKADPHQTPQVILEFARSLAPKMEGAFGNSLAAQPLFEALLGCGADGWELAAVRAICLVNAGRLAEKYPDRFQKAYQEMKGKLPPDVLESVKASGF